MSLCRIPFSRSISIYPLHLYNLHLCVYSLLAKLSPIILSIFLRHPPHSANVPVLPDLSSLTLLAAFLCLQPLTAFLCTPPFLSLSLSLLSQLGSRPCEIKSFSSDKKCLGGKGSQSIRSGLSPNKCYLRVSGLAQ